MDKFIVNIIHRPEMVPEYSATVTGQGKEEDIGDKKLITESLDIFKTQQRLAHEAGLKTTIQMTYASLFNDEAVELAKQDHEKYGDEIALSLLGLPCEEFREKYKTKDFCIWMFSMEDKKAIVNDVFEKFHDRFGFYPESTGSYYMDTPMSLYHKSYHGVRSADVFRSLNHFHRNMRSGHGKDVGLLRYRYPLLYLLPVHVYSV